MGSLSLPGWQSTAGSNHRNAKLTELEAWKILVSPKSAIETAAEFGVSRITVNDIRARRRWKHLKRDQKPQGDDDA